MKRLLVGLLALCFSGAVHAQSYDLGGMSGSDPACLIRGGAGCTMTGDLLFSADGTKDIGKSGATRPRNIFASGTGTFGGQVSISAGGINVGGTAAVTSGDVIMSGKIAAAGSTQLLLQTADGIALFRDSAGTSFSRLQLGGTTSSYPSIKRNATALNFRLADDSADAAITAAAGTFSGTLLGQANVIVGSALVFASSTNLLTGGDGILGITKLNQTTGAVIDVSAGNAFKFRNLANNADAPITAAGITSSGQLNVSAMTQTSVAQSGTVCYNSGTGAVTYDATLGCLASSERFKTDIADIHRADALALTMALAPVSFRKRKDAGGDVDLSYHVGFIAEQVAEVDERLVSRSGDGVRGVRYQELTAILAGAVQELKREFDEFKVNK